MNTEEDHTHPTEDDQYQIFAPTTTMLSTPTETHSENQWAERLRGTSLHEILPEVLRI